DASASCHDAFDRLLTEILADARITGSRLFGRQHPASARPSPTTAPGRHHPPPPPPPPPGYGTGFGRSPARTFVRSAGFARLDTDGGAVGRSGRGEYAGRARGPAGSGPSPRRRAPH